MYVFIIVVILNNQTDCSACKLITMTYIHKYLLLNILTTNS